MKNKKYYLHVCGTKDKHAGSKAVNDCQIILKDNGYKPIIIYKAKHKSELGLKIDRYLRYIRMYFIPKNSELVIQHPLPLPPFYLKMLGFIKEKHNIKLIFLIHDIDSLRRIRLDDLEMVKLRDELMYKYADIIIAHNEKMKQYLIEKCGIREKNIIKLELFDYICDDTSENDFDNTHGNTRVIIAGNLLKEKTGYIYKLISKDFKSIGFNLYGVGWNDSLDNKCGKYMGAYNPDELPLKLEGMYGLVWDGKEIDSCKGTVGEYLQYNNPHKVSLYVAAQKPIIIWEKAALASFVKENKIGITVKSLENLEDAINNVTEDQYKEFKKNLKILSSNVRTGQYLSKALSRLN